MRMLALLFFDQLARFINTRVKSFSFSEIESRYYNYWIKKKFIEKHMFTNLTLLSNMEEGYEKNYMHLICVVLS
jgi:hypothetical protein